MAEKTRDLTEGPVDDSVVAPRQSLTVLTRATEEAAAA